MKYIVVLAFTASLFFTACGSKNKAITASEIQAKADSLVGTKMEEISKQAMEDLDRRMAIEVKAKADSIVLATCP